VLGIAAADFLDEAFGVLAAEREQVVGKS